VAPTPSQLFSDRSGVAVAERFEEYKAALAKSFGRADEGRDVFVKGVGLVRNARPGRDGLAAHEHRMETIERLSKSLTADQQAAMQSELDALKGSLAKDWDASFPESGTMTLPTQLAPIDLEIPAKMLVPRETPLVNQMPRNNTGKGSAVQFRRILGWTNSGVGGLPDIMPFMSSEFPASQSTSNLPSFGGYANTTGGQSDGLGLRRGQKITYAADSKVVNYTELGLSDSVSWKAQYIGQGFQDIRQLSATALLWSHKMGEERGLLYARGVTSNGYTGPIAAPTGVTYANSGSAGGGSIPAGTYYALITAVGSGGETAVSNISSAQTISTSPGTITFTFPALPAGATGWNLYVGASATGTFYFQTFVPGGYPTYVLSAYSSSGVGIPYTAVDTTANPNGYDGLLTILLNPSVSGYVGTYVATGSSTTTINSIGGQTLIGGAAPTAVGDKPWQTAFQVLYGASTEPGNYGMDSGSPSWLWNQGTAYGQKLLADPDTVFVDGAVRAAMGYFVRNAAGGSSAYRITMQTSEATGGLEVGGIVNGIANQVTGKMVDFDVHPYMPPGASLIWSKTLPVPDSEIANTFEVRNVQDYMMQPWPVIQYTYDASTYQLGTLVPYAPAWSGALAGLLP
jgi:hypothetical protein